ncbi:acetoacetate decarboxylase family protein [Sphingomonas sp.]|uniref:acetoacetate decarboxylase family protein n=1 Tax=Sphingomonas sp. TaxID=28214 RepID=UPI003B00A893
MIRPIQHQVGTSDLAKAEVAGFDRDRMAELPLPGAEVHYILFEAPMAQVLRVLPPSLHPCIPGIVAITFVKCPNGPLGPLELALIGVGCRSGIRPRFLITSAFVSDPAMAGTLQKSFGYPAHVAEVRTRVNYDRIRSSIVENGRTLFDASTTGLVTLTGSGGTVLYSPTLSLGKVGDDQRLVQSDWSADFTSVGRGEPEIEAFDAEALTHGILEPTDAICATLARADLVMHKPAFVLDPARLPGEGGVTRLRAA